MLSALLAANPGVFAAGEVVTLSMLSEHPTLACSCGALVAECPFWSSVLKATDSPRAPPESLRVTSRLGELKEMIVVVLEYAVGIRRLNSRLSFVERRLLAISEASRSSVIIDSSRHIGRGLMLRMLPGDRVNVVYIHLIRDGRGVAWSLKTRPTNPPGEPPETVPVPIGAAGWVLRNLLCTLVFNSSPRRYARVRYEDLLANPVKELRRIGSHLGLDVSTAVERLGRGEPFYADHIFDGNPRLSNREIRLNLDTLWQRQMPRQDQRLVWFIGGWLARSYGYRR
ncbi:MAG: sulfotransferase [Thermoplasmata archaeon]